VRKAISHLIYHGCVKMADIFQYTNMYTATEGIRELASNVEMQKACQEQVCLPSAGKSVMFLFCFGGLLNKCPFFSFKNIFSHNFWIV